MASVSIRPLSLPLPPSIFDLSPLLGSLIGAKIPPPAHPFLLLTLYVKSSYGPLNPPIPIYLPGPLIPNSFPSRNPPPRRTREREEKMANSSSSSRSSALQTLCPSFPLTSPTFPRRPWRARWLNRYMGTAAVAVAVAASLDDV